MALNFRELPNCKTAIPFFQATKVDLSNNPDDWLSKVENSKEQGGCIIMMHPKSHPGEHHVKVDSDFPSNG
ncbi:hypothetical protein HYFRA_00007261 [Hymenoscyphus fraxineus]|uniref:Uncharacterized protein n=1 Tax=Hymenoscyphus fraxineus TaxID=746836 RepID=A0A9N9KZ52_9HELO|nr:hypothetical protein HYFRA_00007261 [Hymenoscyphus fraxineus]